MTFEEICVKYPVGKLLAREKVVTKHSGFWTTQADKDFYVNNYKQVKFFSNGNVEFVEEKIKEYHVQGWLYDGTDFFVAENGWDGWCPLDDDDLKEIESKGILYEF